jgi:uncharacterized protein YoxC
MARREGPMTIIEIAAVLAGAAFALLVAYLVPVLIQVRKTVTETERLLIKVNAELPDLIGQIHVMSQNMIELTQQARTSVKHASIFLHSVGEVGESVRRVHQFVKGSSGAMLTKVARLVFELPVAANILKGRASKLLIMGRGKHD